MLNLYVKMKYLLIILLSILGISCGSFSYKFNDVSIDPALKTFKVVYIDNKARYVNPQLTPLITDKLRQKIIAQTRLQPTQGEAHIEISGTLTDYNISTSGVGGDGTQNTNRLTVGLNITIKNNLEPNKNTESNITRTFDFASSQTINQFETARTDEIVKNVVDEIFNKLFSNW